ncbi:MAG: orotidine-5'-phosphate decarboxylase [Dehalococcoides mccartyi]|jgi:orotidine 5''-phosphate decarboxylase, subfamily 2|uniref:Orotidine 5'-phosphate decarboxylase n=2 Tax=root TaxID=1 RepID=A0A0V8LY39_9CHLR|nr:MULTISPECIES: orotidine-5'-phosphate decarboxylase [Dehalococcoides]AII58804.1 orotidine 5'-phosphate decarboxylase [Dehalococcoides mccartyi CG4]AQU02496.1 orotidine 5'-phosphate decarboxylase [Dehalococcoides mccartyi]AQU03859.1 orotidine 5'-phosphate decarboxylase [Dehalococcoides mccartyi]KSV16281.1 orotidine 5'-phosphate decarboxylase [Dehalococcoides mccartyi]MCF7635099.1 orotidine 5'-phosphate decarboxylase [Dehalococcoides mccartyi]
MKFLEKLKQAGNSHNSLLCVGLDPDPKLMPVGMTALEFNREIIAATAPFVCGYKINLAFYEALGKQGWEILSETCKLIPPELLSIADAKRGDIGNTSKAYARAVFDELGCDGVTASPYLGYDSLEPFIEYQDKGIFILCRTSNQGSADFQMLKTEYLGQKRFLYEVVADKALQWNRYENIGLVVGATQQEELKKLRLSYPKMPFLIPGIGAQGGDLKATVENGTNQSGQLALICASRGILYARSGSEFAQGAAEAAKQMRDAINHYRKRF